MAPPKPRSKRYRDLPDNLEPDPQNRNGKPVVYFRYVFPDGRRKSLGKDREHAKAVAKAPKLVSADLSFPENTPKIPRK